MRYIVFRRFPQKPASPNFVISLECRMEYDVCTPCKVRMDHIHLVWRHRLRYSVIFGAPVLPVRARCLMHTILSAPLHPHFGSYLPGWVAQLITGMNTCATAYLALCLCP